MVSEEEMLARADVLTERRRSFRIKDGDDYLVPKHWMYRLERRGILRHVQRGFWADADNWPEPEDLARDFVAHLPSCLLSALHDHDLWEKPYLHWVAIDHRARSLKSWFPIRYVRMSGPALREGIVDLRSGGEFLRTYSLEKTLADCLKYRRAIGEQFAHLALRRAIASGRVDRDGFEHYAGVCRVRSLISPYLLSLERLARDGPTTPA